jgi:hypothetical protein
VAIFVVIAAAAGVMEHPARAGSPSMVQTSGSSAGIAYLGDTISVGGLKCTLLRITVDPTQRSNVHRPPDTEYMTAHVQLYNTGSGYAHVDPTDFHVKAGAGTNVSEEAAIVTTLGAGTLAPGESLAADLVFNVERGNRVIELTWSPRLGVDMHQHAWLLEL